MRGAAATLPAHSVTGFAAFDALRQWLSRFPLSIIQLMGRVGVGAVFFKAGLLKYSSWEFTVQLFRDEYKLPLIDPVVAARISMAQELTIPIFLFLGLATRARDAPIAWHDPGDSDLRLPQRVQRSPDVGLDSPSPSHAWPWRFLFGLSHRTLCGLTAPPHDPDLVCFLQGRITCSQACARCFERHSSVVMLGSSQIAPGAVLGHEA